MSPSPPRTYTELGEVETEPSFILPLVERGRVRRTIDAHEDTRLWPGFDPALRYSLPADWDPHHHLAGTGAWLYEMLPRWTTMQIDLGLVGHMQSVPIVTVHRRFPLVRRAVFFNGY